jgi:hypothetical protein
MYHDRTAWLFAFFVGKKYGSKGYPQRNSAHMGSIKSVLFSSSRLNIFKQSFNPLNAELNPICHLLPLVGAHHILHISGVRVNRSLNRHTLQYGELVDMIHILRFISFLKAVYKNFNRNSSTLSCCYFINGVN